MANSDGDILNKLEAPDGDFLSMPVRLKKSGEPYKNSPVMGTQDFHYMGGYARKEKQLNLEDGFIKEKFVQDRTEIKREQPAIIVRLPMYVDLM